MKCQDGVVTGIGRPLANFICYFSRTQSAHELVLFSGKKIDERLVCGFTVVVLAPCLTFFWDQWRLPRALLSHGIDLFYSPYYKVPLFTPVRIVNQVLDLMYLSFPLYRKNLGTAGRLYYATFGKAFAHKAESIITDSEHAKGDIVRLWHINPEKITVIPLGLSPRYVPVHDENLLKQSRGKFRLPEHFILYLGNFKPHKNIEFLIRLFARLATRFPDYKLVLAGPLDSYGNKMQEVAAREGIADKVVFTGIVRETDLPEALLSLADLFVFPSLYEGFGLPPLEAMAWAPRSRFRRRLPCRKWLEEPAFFLTRKTLTKPAIQLHDYYRMPHCESTTSKPGSKGQSCSGKSRLREGCAGI